MDTVYEYAGAQAASAIHDAFAALGLPLIVACAGIAWRVHRVAEDGAARPLAFYVLSLVLLSWMLRPARLANGERSPRLLTVMNEAGDAAVRAAVRRIDEKFLTDPWGWERVAAMASLGRVQEPVNREFLHRFLAACTRNAMAMGPVPPEAVENPLTPKLPYDQVDWSRDHKCERARQSLVEELQAELGRHAVHRQVLEGAGAGHRDAYLAAIVRNEFHGRVADGGEAALVRRSVGDYSKAASNEAAKRGHDGGEAPAWKALVSPLWWAWETWGTVFVEEFTSHYASLGQMAGDAVTAKQRYYLVTAYAPALHGLVIMMLSALFPIAGLWSLFPGKWTALVNYGKVFVSVKLWPVGWAILSTFTSRRPVEEAFRDDGPSGSVFVAVTLMYFLVPALTFLAVNLAARAAAVPFGEAAPSVAGPGNGPVGDAARMAVHRVR